MLLGVPVGMLSSFAIWWWVTHSMVPIIRFAYSISKRETDEVKSGFRYRCKIKNTGRRAIIDVEIIARLRIKGLREELPNNSVMIKLDVSSDRIPIIRPNRVKIITILPEMNDKFKHDPYPEDIQKKANDGIITLDDLLNIGKYSYLIVSVFGYDEYSGTRKLFESKKYRKNDVKLGLFEKSMMGVIHKPEKK